jgi:hypothetical protein
MSKNEEIVNVTEHLTQLKSMLESCELDFEQYNDDDFPNLNVIELSTGTKFIFDEEGMLLSIGY